MIGAEPKMIFLCLSRGAAFTLVATLAALAAAPAQSQPVTASYPASRATNDVAAWLRRATPLATDQVVDLGATSVTAVTASTPTTEPKGFLATLRAEALDPSIGNQEGILSWEIPVEVDCTKRQVRLGTMTGYPGRDLQIAPRTVRPADTAWVTPTPRAPVGALLRSLCDSDFQRPFPSSGRTLAAAAIPTTGKLGLKATAPVAPVVKAVKPVATAPPPPALRGAAAISTAPAASAGSATVQVGASPSAADVKILLARVEAKFAADLRGLSSTVATVKTADKTVYRALITGLHSASDANRLCEKLQAAGQACFVRR